MRKITYSQNSLKAYRECPLRFKYKYVDSIFHRRYSPEMEEYNERMKRGVLFHLNIKRMIGSIKPDNESMRPGDSEAYGNVASLLRVLKDKDYTLIPEFRVFGELEGESLIADIDLIAYNKDRNTLEIFDWKTGTHVPQHLSLERRMQTKVYLVLVYKFLRDAYGIEISEENISMTYFYPYVDTKRYTVKFSREKYDKYLNEIEEIIRNIKHDISEDSFPETDNPKHCEHCELVRLCPSSAYYDECIEGGEIDE